MDKPMQTHAVSLAKGAAVLGIAALISKMLGVLQKIPLQNIGGDEAFGIYSIVFPFYTFILFLSTAGFPVAVSKFVSEAETKGDGVEARLILFVACVILSITGVLCFFILFFGAEEIGRLIGNEHVILSLKSVSLSLLFVPILSALRGYFQGKQNMMPTAVSQVWEQFIRVGVMLALITILEKEGRESAWIAAGATFGSTAGAIAGLTVMYWYWLKERRKQKNLRFSPWKWEGKQRTHAYLYWMRRLTAYALPICLGAVVMPILNIVDTFSIPRILRLQGYSSAMAVQEFGVYARGLPLVQMVSMLFSSMSVALVPSIAESKIRGQDDQLRTRVQTALRMTWLIGLGASAGVASLAVYFNPMFYMNDAGTWTMAILAGSIVFSVINIISASVLQGLDAVKIPAFHLVIAALMKVMGNLILVPLYGITGAAVAAVVSFGVAALLNMLSLKRRGIFRMEWSQEMVKPLGALTAMLVSLWIWNKGLAWGMSQFLSLPIRADATIHALTSVCIGALIYVVILLLVGGIKRQEVMLIPLIGPKLVRTWFREKNNV